MRVIYYCSNCDAVCSNEVGITNQSCPDCRNKLVEMGLTQDEWRSLNADEKAQIKSYWKTKLISDTAMTVVEKAKFAGDFIVTTTPNIEGYTIETYIGIVSGECALGTGVFSELGAAYADFFGTSTKGYSSKIGSAKNEAIALMIQNARQIGANAVVGVDIDIMTMGNNMAVACANGTAVSVKKM